MSSYTVIKTINLGVLNNAEYLAFMKGILALLPVEEEEDSRPGGLSLLSAASENGVEALGLSAEFVTVLEQDVEALADVVDETHIAQETEDAGVKDKTRDTIATYVTTLIANACKSPVAAENEAGNALHKVIKPYIGLAQLPNAQETVKIEGLLADLRKPEHETYVTALKLETYLTELETVNKSFAAALMQRLQTRAATKRESGATIRVRLGEKYEELALLAQSYNIVQPTDETKTFVDNLNQLIVETTTTYNLRAKRPKKGGETSSGGEEGERPGEL